MDENLNNEQRMDLTDDSIIRGGVHKEEVKEYGKWVVISILAILIFVAAIAYFCII